MNHPTQNRREFVRNSVISSLTPILFGCTANSLAQRQNDDILKAVKRNAIADSRNEWWGALDAPPDVGWAAKLVSEADQGERIVVNGTVFKPDGRTPAPNSLIYLYHTDIYGIYGREGQHRHGKYRAWMLTDSRGRYRFESIKPASYPNSTIASHIHMTVTTEKLKEDWIDSILFDGDRFITPRERTGQKGGFEHVLKFAKNGDGVLSAVRDIKLWG